MPEVLEIDGLVGLEVTLIIKLGNCLVRAFTTDRRQSRCYSLCMNKTVTSAGHDEERIGCSEGKAANEQSTDTVPTQAAELSQHRRSSRCE